MLPVSGWADLTDTQRMVAELVIDGLTNRDAAQLFLSPHTIDFHLRQIYRKLGVRSRVELARLAGPPRAKALPGPAALPIAPAQRDATLQGLGGAELLSSATTRGCGDWPTSPRDLSRALDDYGHSTTTGRSSAERGQPFPTSPTRRARGGRLRAFVAPSCVVFLAAHSVGLLFAARALQGIAVGTATGALGAALIDPQPGGSGLAPLITTAASTLGLGVGALGTSALAQYGPGATRLVWWLLLGASVAVAAGILAMPEPGTRRARRPGLAAAPGGRAAPGRVPGAVRSDTRHGRRSRARPCYPGPSLAATVSGARRGRPADFCPRS